MACRPKRTDLGSLERCSGVHGERLCTPLPELGVHRRRRLTWVVPAGGFG